MFAVRCCTRRSKRRVMPRRRRAPSCRSSEVKYTHVRVRVRTRTVNIIATTVLYRIGNSVKRSSRLFDNQQCKTCCGLGHEKFAKFSTRIMSRFAALGVLGKLLARTLERIVQLACIMIDFLKQNSCRLDIFSWRESAHHMCSCCLR